MIRDNAIEKISLFFIFTGLHKLNIDYIFHFNEINCTLLVIYDSFEQLIFYKDYLFFYSIRTNSLILTKSLILEVVF